MKILLVGRLPHREIGGVPIYTQGLANALVAAGAEVDVLFPGPGAADGAAYGELPCTAIGKVPAWLGPRARRFAEGFAQASMAPAVVRQRGHDVVNVQYGGAMDLAVVRALLATGVPVLVTAHCGPSWWHLRRLPSLACGVLGRAAAVLTLSRDQRDLFARHGIAPSRLHDAPALIEAGFFAAVPATPRSDEGMYLGRIAPGKGIETLLAALARCSAKPVVRLVGPSQEAYRLQLMRLAGRLGVTAALRWHPPVQTAAQRRELLAGCGFLVHPTHQDVRPLALIEAMAVGVPILASALPGTLELLAGHGRTVPVGDAAALAAGLQAMAAAAPDAAAAARGRELAAAYHPAKAAARFLALAEQAIAATAPVVGRR